MRLFGKIDSAISRFDRVMFFGGIFDLATGVALPDGGYKVYGPAAARDAIDWNAPTAGGTVIAGVDAVTISGLGLAEDTDYWFGLRAVSAAGVDDGTIAEVARVRIHDGELVAPPPNAIAWAVGRAAAGGKIAVRYVYSSAGQLAEPATIELALVTGGVPDWGSPEATKNVSGGDGRGELTTASAWGTGDPVSLAIRAVSAAPGSVPGAELILDDVAADATPPGDVESITAIQYG